MEARAQAKASRADKQKSKAAAGAPVSPTKVSTAMQMNWAGAFVLCSFNQHSSNSQAVTVSCRQCIV